MKQQIVRKIFQQGDIKTIMQELRVGTKFLGKGRKWDKMFQKAIAKAKRQAAHKDNQLSQRCTHADSSGQEEHAVKALRPPES